MRSTRSLWYGACAKNGLTSQNHLPSMVGSRPFFPLRDRPSEATVMTVVMAAMLMVGVFSSPLEPAFFLRGSTLRPDESSAGQLTRTSDCGNVTDSIVTSERNLSFTQSDCSFDTRLSSGPSTTPSRIPGSINLTFQLGGLAEIDGVGKVVQFTNMSGDFVGRVNSYYSATQDEYVLNTSFNVFHSSGLWTPASFSQIQNTIVGPEVGTVSVQLELITQVAPANASAVQFEVDASGWPWASPSDHLGLELGAIAQPGGALSSGNSSLEITEEAAQSNAPTASLVFGDSAIASGPITGPADVSVTASSSISHSASTPGEAEVLLNFTGGGDGYTALHYDPWVVFGVPPISHLESSPVIDAAAVLAVVAGAATAFGLGVVAVRARQKNSEFDLAAL